MGVHATVIKDVERIDGELAETTFDYFAQDQRRQCLVFR